MCRSRLPQGEVRPTKKAAVSRGFSRVRPGRTGGIKPIRDVSRVSAWLQGGFSLPLSASPSVPMPPPEDVR